MPIVVNIEGVGKVNFPDNYTPEKIKFAIEKDILPSLKNTDLSSLQSKETNDFKSLTLDEKKQLVESRKNSQIPKVNQSEFTNFEAPTGRESLGRGMMDVGQGIKQVALNVGEGVGLVTPGKADQYTKDVTDEINRYEKGQGEDVDWMRLGGNIAATAPAALIPGGAAASMGTRVASSAAQGGIASGSMFTKEGDSKLGQITIGALVGGAVPVVLQGIKSTLGSVINKFKSQPGNLNQLRGEITATLQSNGVDPKTLSNEVIDSLVADAQKALKTGDVIDPEMLARKSDIESVGAKPFKAALTRNPRDWQQFKNLRGIEGVGDDIVRVEQDNAIALGEALQKIGGSGKTRYQVGESVLDAVSSKEREMQDVVRNLYKKAEQEFGGKLTTAPTNLLGMADEISVRADADPIISSVNRYLTKRGLVKKGALVEGKALSLKESEELRKLIRDVSFDKGRSMRDIGGKLIDALDEDVFSVFEKGNPYQTAREAARAKFKEFSSNSLKRAIDDKITPDQLVNNYIFSKGKVDEVRKLVNVLKTGSQGQVERGSAALKDVQDALVDSLLLKSTGATSIDDIAGKPFSGRNFSKALNAIEPEKLHVLLKPDQIAALRQVEKVAKLLTEEVPFSDVNYSKTAAALANIMKKFGNVPILGPIMTSLKGSIEARAAMSGSSATKAPARLLPASRFEGVIPGGAAAALTPVSD